MNYFPKVYFPKGSLYKRVLFNVGPFTKASFSKFDTSLVQIVLRNFVPWTFDLKNFAPGLLISAQWKRTFVHRNFVPKWTFIPHRTFVPKRTFVPLTFVPKTLVPQTFVLNRTFVPQRTIVHKRTFVRNIKTFFVTFYAPAF